MAPCSFSLSSWPSTEASSCSNLRGICTSQQSERLSTDDLSSIPILPSSRSCSAAAQCGSSASSSDATSGTRTVLVSGSVHAPPAASASASAPAAWTSASASAAPLAAAAGIAAGIAAPGGARAGRGGGAAAVSSCAGAAASQLKSRATITGGGASSQACSSSSSSWSKPTAAANAATACGEPHVSSGSVRSVCRQSARHVPPRGCAWSIEASCEKAPHSRSSLRESGSASSCCGCSRAHRCCDGHNTDCSRRTATATPCISRWRSVEEAWRTESSRR
jgi:hypothetical protein